MERGGSACRNFAEILMRKTLDIPGSSHFIHSSCNSRAGVADAGRIAFIAGDDAAQAVGGRQGVGISDYSGLAIQRTKQIAPYLNLRRGAFCSEMFKERD
jgi:hypothetical protein